MNDRINDRKEAVEFLIGRYEWDLLEYQSEQFNMRLRKGKIVVNIWLSKLTVAIISNGKQYFYKKLSELEVEKILINPTNYLKPQE